MLLIFVIYESLYSILQTSKCCVNIFSLLMVIYNSLFTPMGLKELFWNTITGEIVKVWILNVSHEILFLPVILFKDFFLYLLATVHEAMARSTRSTADVRIVSAPPLWEKSLLRTIASRKVSYKLASVVY